MRVRKTRAQLRDEAYERLGVTPEQVSTVPQISHLLRRLDGGRSAAIALLRGSANPDARRFLEVYDDAPVTLRARLPIEAFCLAAGIPTYRMAGIVVEEAVRQGTMVSIVIAASNLPRIVRKTVEMALTNGGVRDREMLLQATGFLPLPRGSTIPILTALPTTRQRRSSRFVVRPSPEVEEGDITCYSGHALRLRNGVGEESAQQVGDAKEAH